MPASRAVVREICSATGEIQRPARARLARLEARSPGGADAVARDAATFDRRMAGLCAGIEAAGDFTDAPGASPAERYCRTLLQGDGDTAGAILRDSLGGLP